MTGTKPMIGISNTRLQRIELIMSRSAHEISLILKLFELLKSTYLIRGFSYSMSRSAYKRTGIKIKLPCVSAEYSYLMSRSAHKLI